MRQQSKECNPLASHPSWSYLSLDSRSKNHHFQLAAIQENRNLEILISSNFTNKSIEFISYF